MTSGHLAALACIAVLSAAAPSAASANDVFKRSWGGIEFSDSDRDEQAAGDTYAIGVDSDTGGLLSVGRASSAQWLYRYGPDGRQTQRFRLRKSVTAVTSLGGGEVVTGTAAGRVQRYDRRGKVVADFPAGGRVRALIESPGGVLVATGTSITEYSPSGARGTVLDIPNATGLEVGPEGVIAVADGTSAKLYASDGRLLRTFAGLDRPDQAAIDGRGRVYVHDAGGGGFAVNVFAADGTPLGSTTAGFYDLQSQAKESPSSPQLLAVTAGGDVYYTAQNPDILRIPASVVPAPRFRISDESRGVPQFHDTDPIAVSVGKEARLTTNVFRSLSSGLSISLAAPPKLILAAGVEPTVPVTIPDGKDFTPVDWMFRVTKPGRVPATFTVRGTDPDGRPTALAKKLPVYGVDGPNITIEGAATRPGAKYSLVALTVDIGATKIAKADRADLLQYLSDTFEVETSARIGGKPVEELGFEIGESLTGMCVPFPTKGTPQIAVTAKIAEDDRFDGATAKRTVRPTTRPRSRLMRECYKAIDLAGL